MTLEVAFWRSDGGNEPVREWLRGLASEVRKAVGDDIRYVQANWPIGKPYVDGFGNGLYEVRTKHNNIHYRVLFSIHQRTMILLHYIVKKTRKTPNADIALARERQKE